MSNIKTTITQLHVDKIKEISDAEARLPLLKSELDSLNNELKLFNPDTDIVKIKDTEQKIINITAEMTTISDMQMNYYKTCGFLLTKYMKVDKRNKATVTGLDMLGKKQFNKSKNKKKILYNTYRSIIDPTYVSVEEDSVNEENYCYQCKTFRVTISEEAIMACPRCGCQVTVTQKYTKPSANDPPTENKTCDYQRYSHFCNWIDKIQGKETLIIPEQIIKSVKREIKKERKCDSLNKLTENDIRNYLKKNKKYKDEKYDHFYDHSTKILWIVTGIRPIQMTPEMESNLQSLFMAIQEPFEMYKQDRNNFSSYSYILYKFCQLLGYKAFLHKLRLHKNEALIYKHDCIWKKICEYMGGEEKGWVFIKTYLY